MGSPAVAERRQDHTKAAEQPAGQAADSMWSLRRESREPAGWARGQWRGQHPLSMSGVVADGCADGSQLGKEVSMGQSGTGGAVNTQTRKKRNPVHGEGHGLCSSCRYIMRQILLLWIIF